MHGRPKDLRSRMTPKLGSARCGTLDSRFNCSELHFLPLQNGNGEQHPLQRGHSPDVQFILILLFFQ